MKRVGDDVNRTEFDRAHKRRVSSNEYEPLDTEDVKSNLLLFEAPPLQRNRDLDPEYDFAKNYKITEKIQEGSYGIVSKAIEKSSNTVVAIKKFKPIANSAEGFTVNGIREIVALQALRHSHIIHLRKITVENQNVYIILDFVENDLRSILRNMPVSFSESESKTILWQLLSALEYMHDKWYMHRDLSPSNILLDNHGNIKIADFGLCRQFGDDSGVMLTSVVVTQYYRPPEILLLGNTHRDQFYVPGATYGPEIDIWSLGCIFAEIVGQRVYFKGKSDIDQLLVILKTLNGTNDGEQDDDGEIFRVLETSPHDVLSKYSLENEALVKIISKSLPRLSSSGPALVTEMLQIDPAKRITASKCLDHVYFKEKPLPKNPELFPTFPRYAY